MEPLKKPLAACTDEELSVYMAACKAQCRTLRAIMVEVAAERDRRTNEAEAQKLLEKHGAAAIARAHSLAQKVTTAAPVASGGVRSMG